VVNVVMRSRAVDTRGATVGRDKPEILERSGPLPEPLLCFCFAPTVTEQEYTS